MRENMRTGIGGQTEEERHTAGGHLCHQLQRVMVGEVKIKACRRRLAPQPRLNPPPLPSVVFVGCVWVCACVMGEGDLSGVDMHRWVTGVAAVTCTAYFRSIITGWRGTWAWGAPFASLLIRQIILMSHCVGQGVWTGINHRTMLRSTCGRRKMSCKHFLMFLRRSLRRRSF